MQWLIIYDSGVQEIVQAADLDELQGKVDSDDVMLIVRLNNNIYAESYSPYK